MPRRGILIAVDSVGIDPLGHDRPNSVYRDSEFLFPKGSPAEILRLPHAPVEGALAQTSVTGGLDSGAMECAITYTSIFTGRSAAQRHGLMHGLALNDAVLEQMVGEANLFRCFPTACLANAIFPAHMIFLGGSYVEDGVPHVSRAQGESALTFRGRPVRLVGPQKHGLPELFTLGEINQNIFVHAAREARVPLLTYADVRAGNALTSSMTHELEAQFNLEVLGQMPLPPRSPAQAGEILAKLAARHEFVFYKYQIPDLISHTGRVELARAVFGIIEQFVRAVLENVDPEKTIVVVTSDHGHLEQVGFAHGHPKSDVPTWYFGPEATKHAQRLRTPEAIFHLFAKIAT